jgi:hypothetical protein
VRLAQSLARSLGSAGIRVALDVIDSPQTRSQRTDKRGTFFIQPDPIAETSVG